MEIDRQANEQIDFITSRLAKAEGVTTDLKANDLLKWIRGANSVRIRAEAQVIR
ncbi:MAG: TnpV protein [Clostridia bacterium]|nr:TnpV protein [Clostridia bacterium]